MTKERANLLYDSCEMEGCCGVRLILDFCPDFLKKGDGEKYQTAAALKEGFKTDLEVFKVGMLVATTALETWREEGKIKYGNQDNLLIERKLKASGWKRANTAINPKTGNKITTWTFT